MKIDNLTPQPSFKSLPTEKIANELGEYFLQFRRPFKHEILSKSDKQYFLSIIREKALPYINKGEPIKTAIVGFSMKCPSPLKVVSQNADRAEFEALKHLSNLTEGVSEIYKPGAILDIFADGRMFVGSIFGSADEKVTTYISQLKEFLAKINSPKIKIHAPEDFYAGSFDSVRRSLTNDFPISKSKIQQDVSAQEYIRFMRDFYAKDIHAQDRTISIRQSKRMGEIVANSVINAAESFSNFVLSLYPQGMIRFSVHGKPLNNADKKIGIFLNSLNENCPTPWHGAAIKLPNFPQTPERFLYDKKIILERIGAKFIPDLDGKGCYYEFPNNIHYDTSKSLKDNLSILI